MSGPNDPNDGFERLLRGELPVTPAEHELGAFLEDVRTAFPAEPLLAEEVHLAAIAEAAQLLADKGDPVARPVSNATGRARHASWLPKRRRVTVRVPVLKSLVARVVAGFVVLMSMFGGIAFAAALPGSVQDTVTDAVVGIADLPDGEDEVASEDPAETETESDDQGEDESATETETESDDQGEDGDDQGATETVSDDQGEDESATETVSDDQGEDESATETESSTETETE